MVFLTDEVRNLRDTVIYLRTAISMARSENAFSSLDSRIENLSAYQENIRQSKELATGKEGVDEYLTALTAMEIEVENMLETAQRKKKKNKKSGGGGSTYGGG